MASFTVTTTAAHDAAIAYLLAAENAAKVTANAKRTADWQRLYDQTVAIRAKQSAAKQPLTPLPEAPTLETQETAAQYVGRVINQHLAELVSKMDAVKREKIVAALADPAKRAALETVAGVA